MSEKRKKIMLVVGIIGIIGIGILGGLLGKKVGTIVGTAVGSYNGITKKFPEGETKGKNEGLSASDTTTKVGNSLKEIAKLEVLVSSFKLNDYHELGNKYAALYLLKADAIFTVDLSKASFKDEEGMIQVRVPQPEVAVSIDERYTEKAIESQRKFFNGSAEDGFNVYINSMSNLEENAENSIKSDENLMKSARDSAEKQIRRLIRDISLNGEELSIVWE